MALRIGLTGGIGSGKSVVARIFEVLGIPVYYADAEARRIQNEDPRVRQQIIDLFGRDAYNQEGLNRALISKIVFSDPDKLTALNAIVHPATIRDAAAWFSSQTAPYAVKEAALIFESGSQRDLDHVIGVFAPASLRIQRVMKRDGIQAEDVKKRMAQQMEDRIARKLCDFVVENDDQQLLIPQVLKIHVALLKEAIR